MTLQKHSASAHALRAFRCKHRLSPQRLADLVAYSLRQVQRLESGVCAISTAFKKLRDICACYFEYKKSGDKERFVNRVILVLETVYFDE